MSIASEITRLGSLRDTIRSKLISAGIISNESAKLSECASAIDGMDVNSKVSKVLDTSTTSVAIPKGYHKEAGTVSISAQEKTKNISSGTATVTPDSGKVLKKVTVNGPTSYADTTQFASAITQDDDNTYFAVPNAGYYNTGSKIAAKNSNLGGNGDDFFFALSGVGAYMSIPSGNEFYAVWNGEYTPDSISNISVLEGNLNSKNTLVKCKSTGDTCGIRSTSTWAYNTSVCILYNYSNKYKVKKGSSITLDDIADGSTVYIVTVNSEFSGTDILFSTLLASKSSSGNNEYIRIYKAKANKNATISNALAVFY